MRKLVGTMTKDDLFMRQALSESRKALDSGEVPIGAVLVHGGKVLSRAHNKTITDNDPTAHAEIVAIRKACLKRKNYRLTGCDLYVTLEPCAMCLGAAVQARLSKIVFGAPDPKGGAVESIMVFPFDRTNHRPEIRSGVLEKDCSEILKKFFRAKRKELIK